jgi:chromosome segregation ATPase
MHGYLICIVLYRNEKLLKQVEMKKRQIQHNKIEYETSSNQLVKDIEKELITLLDEEKEEVHKRKAITNKAVMLVRDKLESLTATNKSLVDEVNYLNNTMEKMKQELAKDEKIKETHNNTEEALSSFLSESEKTASVFEKTLLSFKEKLAEADINKEEGYINLIKSQQKQINELTNENIELKQVVSSLQDRIKQFTH